MEDGKSENKMRLSWNSRSLRVEQGWSKEGGPIDLQNLGRDAPCIGRVNLKLEMQM